MPWYRWWLCALACAGFCAAQAPPSNPVVSPRGAVNAFTQQPAPSRVAAGGLLWIQGLHLGPAETLTAEAPWPLELGGVEVLINGRPAPVGSVSPGRIVVQVPWETPAGLAQAVVRRGGATSRPARFLVENLSPSIRTEDDSGAGEPYGSVSGGKLTLSASGLGPTEPRAASGEAAAHPLRGPVRAYVGGLATEASARLSGSRVGEFDVEITIPEGAGPGDLITVVANGRAANRTVYGSLSGPEVSYLKFPENHPEMRSLVGSDLRGTFLAGAAARGAGGCFDSYIFDLAAKSVTPFDGCLVSALRQAPNPFTAAAENSAIAALAGPAIGEPPGPVSSNVKIARPGAEPILVELPAPAENLLSNANGNFVAMLADDTNVEIDAATGQTRPLAGAAGGAGGGDRPAALNLNALEIDLGDGLKYVLSAPAGVQQAGLAVVVGDDENAPRRAKVALINLRGEVIETRDFPAGWVPLVPPAPAAPPAGGQVPGAPNRFRVSTSFDAPSRTLYVLSRKADNSAHAIAAFGESASVIEFPQGWFAATCTARVPLFHLELSRRLALIADKSSATELRNPCPGQGFLVFDIARQSTEVVPLPGAGQINAPQAADMNDYVFSSNTDPSRAGRADTLYVLDGVTATAYRFDPPPNVATFGPLVPFPEMALLIAQATNRVAGDAGFAVFDLERAETRIFPTPEGFANVQLLGILPTTRKLVSRGNKPDGSSILVYDLLSGDLSVVPNPPGVAWMGAPPQQPPTPGAPRPPEAQAPGLAPRVNAKANTVEMVTYDAARRQTGVAVVRVH